MTDTDRIKELLTTVKNEIAPRQIEINAGLEMTINLEGTQAEESAAKWDGREVIMKFDKHGLPFEVCERNRIPNRMELPGIIDGQQFREVAPGVWLNWAKYSWRSLPLIVIRESETFDTPSRR